MRKQSFDRGKKVLAILLAVLFVLTLTAVSVGAFVSTNATSSVQNGNDCREYNRGYYNGYQKGYHDGFVYGRNCEKARIFPMIYYAPCSSGYNGGYFNGYRTGYNHGYAYGKKFCHQSIQ
jgi:hypothetical protein